MLTSDRRLGLIVGLRAEDTRRFGELRHEIGGVTQKVLTQTLRDMERNGLVTRRVYAEVPPRVEYSLTPLGRTLIEPLSSIRSWAMTNIEEVLAAQVRYDNQRQIGSTSPLRDAGSEARDD